MPDAYRQEKQAAGEGYERFHLRRLRRAGHQASRFESKADQLAHGDLLVDGVKVEVKFDMKLSTEGKLYIEVDERVESTGTYVPSGIRARADWKWYLIGDEDEWYWLWRRDLLDRMRDFVDAGKRLATAQDGRGHGFYISRRLAIELAGVHHLARAGRRRSWSDTERATSSAVLSAAHGAASF